MQMHKKRILKDDGRYLVFYWFDNEPEPVVEQAAQPNTEHPTPSTDHV